MLKSARPDLNLYFHLRITNCRCFLRGNTETNLNRKKSFLQFSLVSASMYLFQTKELSYTNYSVKLCSPCFPCHIYILLCINIAVNIVYVCSITMSASPKWEPRERDKDAERLCVSQSVSWPGGPTTQKKQDVWVDTCVCVCVAARVHQKVKA